MASFLKELRFKTYKKTVSSAFLTLLFVAIAFDSVFSDEWFCRQCQRMNNQPDCLGCGVSNQPSAKVVPWGPDDITTMPLFAVAMDRPQYDILYFATLERNNWWSGFWMLGHFFLGYIYNYLVRLRTPSALRELFNTLANPALYEQHHPMILELPRSVMRISHNEPEPLRYGRFSAFNTQIYNGIFQFYNRSPRRHAALLSENMQEAFKAIGRALAQFQMARITAPALLITPRGQRILSELVEIQLISSLVSEQAAYDIVLQQYQEILPLQDFTNIYDEIVWNRENSFELFLKTIHERLYAPASEVAIIPALRIRFQETPGVADIYLIREGNSFCLQVGNYIGDYIGRNNIPRLTLYLDLATLYLFDPSASEEQQDNSYIEVISNLLREDRFL